MSKKPVVGILMGSKSDLSIMEHTFAQLEEFGIPYEKAVLSAHRTPDETIEYAKTAYDRGLKVIIAAAGGSAHLAGVVAGCTTIPVIGVPIKAWSLEGLDSLLSIVQMPAGIPVATVAIGKAGAKNAAILCASMLSVFEPEYHEKMLAHKESMRKAVLEDMKI